MDFKIKNICNSEFEFSFFIVLWGYAKVFIVPLKKLVFS